MSTPVEKDSERSSRQRGSSECKPLLDATTKNLFRKNAFRILGLPVDATTLEITKHANKLMILVEGGQDPHTQGAAFPIKPSPSLDEIREAIQKIKDPEKRLIDEFFWFWPEEFGNSQADPAMRALSMGDLETASQIWSAKEEQPIGGLVAKHNLALVFHIAALDWENYSVKNEVEAERRQKISDYWKGAFNRWERLATDETLWEKVTVRIRQLNEPNLPTGFARRMRAALPEALDKINAELAVAFAESGKIELARLHIRFMRETNQGLDNVEKTAELVLTPARNRLKEQIQRAKQSAQQNPATAHDAARILIDHARPLLDVFDLFFGEQDHFQKELFDDAATTAVNCLVAYQRKTGDNDTFVKLLEQTLLIAESIEVRRRVEENIGIGKGNLSGKKFDAAYASLKEIRDSTEHPRKKLEKFSHDVSNAINSAVAGLSHSSDNRNQLFDSAAIVLRDISLVAWNTHQDLQTAVAANEMATQYACDLGLRKHLLDDRAKLGQMMMGVRLPSLTGDHPVFPSHQPKAANPAWIGWLVVGAIIFVLFIIGSCNSTNNSSSSTGNVYQVPSSVSSTLNSEKAEIESERATIEALETQIEKLGREIERDRLYLDRTNQIAVDEFNAKVDRYNALNQRAKIANTAFNAKVDNYNAKLRQNGR